MDIELAQAHADHEARRNQLIGKIDLTLPREGESILYMSDDRITDLLKEIKEFLEEGDI